MIETEQSTDAESTNRVSPRVRAGSRHTGARAKAWCLSIHAKASLSIHEPSPCVCMGIHTHGKSLSDLGRALVLDDPPTRGRSSTRRCRSA